MPDPDALGRVTVESLRAFRQRLLDDLRGWPLEPKVLTIVHIGAYPTGGPVPGGCACAICRSLWP